MNLRFFCSIILFILCANLTTAQDIRNHEDLKGFADYLVGLKQGFARFEQLNPDGTISRGSLLVQRPSSIRIEYDPPSSGLIIADRLRVAVFDLKSNTAPVIVPLRSTPFYILIQDNIRIDDLEIIESYEKGNKISEVQVKIPSSSFKGSLRLLFENEPIRLVSWIYTDQFGQTIRMEFSDLIPNIQIDKNLFDIDGVIRELSKN